MQPESKPMAEVQPERVHLARKPNHFRLGKSASNLVGRNAWLQEIDRFVHPFARIAVRGVLRWSSHPYVERSVVTGAITHERLDDVEERLVAGTDEPVGEVVRMRAAALARDGVDRFHAIAAHLVQAPSGKRDN